MQVEEAPAEIRPATSEIVLVLDFGAQYTQLIARRIRELRVYSLILPYDAPLARIRDLRPKGIVLSGGPRSVYEPGAPQADPALLSLGIPVLGICYGMQWMAHVLGGRTGPSLHREYGRTRLVVEEPDVLFAGLERRLLCWMSHGDAVLELPPGFVSLARTDRGVCAAMAHPARRLFGVQFHPEVSHTPWGREVLRNFLFTVCGCTGSWTMTSFLEEAIVRVREQVGRGRVLCALSGGVDSSAAAALVHRAVGDQLSCIFVDHGFLRKGEAEQVVRTFRDHFRIPLLHVDASPRFLERLRGVSDPEEKRRRIGEEFVRVFEEHARRLEHIDFLVQGTLYPDVIESGTRTAARIKTHHNVGGLPERMSFRLVEPFRELFKDEVRELAKTLGLPDELIWRHPFPGPGLAIRVVGEVTEERLRILREADAIVTEEIRRAGLARALWQAFCVLLPVRAVGVAGDARTYGYAVVVRAVTSEDGMTADWARLPPELLETLAARITREVPEITRVVYDITSKPPATIEWE
ncbi:MAG: glutamine-hydrolyzing GMP synthase [Armatimonadota bacterium]|nr:glutamine-hydrolyzing GMP synthase [Armatimonadota bacterium]MDR7440107.1 glutamine-hydrolyzing GMP synthase [Armatimonadota bacterium]MDR7563845.1 glutamine-hydrolyzing GMP synthase [Armatimonadota bacterium]MDR7567059.1 glutamine-hydrolyzing GMP synthase [Armatimonadota bacterium]MDR7601524.1 glutamine-hydrolyzing GMP synthase [Armatimonadota bacterium]